jgi:hypothetical protein
LLAFPATTVGIGTAGFGGSGDASMANSDFALMKILDAKRVTEGAGEFLEFENFTGVGLFVDAMEGFESKLEKILSDGTIGCEHEFFDEAMGNVAFAAGNVVDLLLFIEFDDGRG